MLTERRPLNEGRGANPGDTRAMLRAAPAALKRAQRRPGREPRRHDGLWLLAGRITPRSTKAGARTPATRAGRAALRRPAPCPLNEGRGANPGDTPDVSRASGNVREHRSTKAGARTPATRPPGHLAGNHGPRRSTKAGARTPATPAASAPSAAPRRRAQRRPGREPRRHLPPGTQREDTWFAQRRPGREPRRHTVRVDWAPAAALAQRRPGREPRRHLTVGCARPGLL